MKIRILKDFLIYGFAAYGFFWTIIESASYFKILSLVGTTEYLSIILVSVLIGIIKCLPVNSVSIPIPVSDSVIEIKFGDIFDGNEIVVIPVNEFFDGSIGDHVSEVSIHGQFIKNFLGGQSSTFNQLTKKELEGIESEIVSRSSGRKSKFPIGTVIATDVNDRRFLLAALTRTNITTLKASANFQELWHCLNGIWTGIRNFSNGKSVKLPLLGSGLAGVGLPPKILIEIIILSYIYNTKKNKITNHITLVLPDSLKSEIDLILIKRNWK